jgi:hypothetical protein
MEHMKINIENLEKIPQDQYFIDKSEDDQNGCIHVPVVLAKRNGVPGINHDIDSLVATINKKYSSVCFTGEWKFITKKDNEEEYVFYYKIN